jgi:hypothetical protein
VREQSAYVAAICAGIIRSWAEPSPLLAAAARVAAAAAGGTRGIRAARSARERPAPRSSAAAPPRPPPCGPGRTKAAAACVALSIQAFGSPPSLFLSRRRIWQGRERTWDSGDPSSAVPTHRAEREAVGCAQRMWWWLLPSESPARVTTAASFLCSLHPTQRS